MEAVLPALQRETLFNKQGVKYRDFLSSLKPKYKLVWIHIFLGHLALGANGISLVILNKIWPIMWPFTTFISSIIFGYTLAYILLFIHEAAHYNLCPSRKLNDILCNVFIGSLFGQDIKSYRPIHFDHHRKHGEPDDPEHSYFDPLNMMFFAKTLFGFRFIGVFKEGKYIFGKKRKKGDEQISFGFFAIGMLINAAIVCLSLINGLWYLALSWVFAVVCFFPFFASIRQLLEHRSELAQSGSDYSKTPHGEVNRLFGDGPVTSSFGGAGFNRHLLHHWEPQISYTRLHELEKFLCETELSSEIEKHQTTYFKTFRKLFHF